MKENIEEKDFAQEKNPIQVADRLFAALETLAETGPITLADLQARLQLNKSTVHRLLASLSHMGYVKQDPATALIDVLGRAYLIPYFIMLVLFLCTFLYLFPIQARYRLRVRDIIKNAFLLSVAALPWTLLCLVIIGGTLVLTFKMMSLANKILDRMDILETVRPYLKQISEETGETVHFVQMEDTWAVYMAKEYSYRNSVRMVSRVGNRIPLYCSGVGKALLACLSDEEVAEIWSRSQIQALTPNTITTFDGLMEVLADVRQRGYAIDDEENELGVRCVAIALPDPETRGLLDSPGADTRYALSISAPVSRMSDVLGY